MFASFDAKTGAPAVERAKQTRTDRGCYPCRAKKKKCDLQRPRCYRCRNSTTVGQVCRWPPDSDNIGLSDRTPSTYSSAQPSTGSSIPSSAESSASSSVHSPDQPNLPPRSDPLMVYLTVLCQSAAVQDAIRITPKLSVEDLPARLAYFELIVMGPAAPDRSVCQMGMPLALSHRPLLHAFLACSGLPKAHLQPELRTSYLLHYNRAVTGFLGVLQRTGPKSLEWMQSTILLLHIFEEYQGIDDVFESRQSHIRGAHLLFRETILYQPPTTPHGINLLSAYTYRTCVNALFDPDCGLSFDHVTTALQTLTRAGSHLGEADEVCPWVGFLGFPMCDLIYKLSWMINACPDPSVAMARRFIEEGSLQQMDDMLTWQWSGKPLTSTKILKTRKIHVAAIKVLTAIWMNNSTTEVLDLSMDGINVLQENLAKVQADELDAWPITILSCGCPPDYRPQLRKYVDSIRQWISPGAISRMTDFFEKAWTMPYVASGGASALLNKNATKLMFF